MTGPTEIRYPIAAVRERLRHHPRPVLDLAVGGDRLEPPAALDDELRRPLGEALRPASAEQTERLRTVAAGFMERVYGVEVDPAAILPLPGGRSGLALVASTVAEPGRGLVVTTPTYPAMERLGLQVGGRLDPVRLDPERGFALCRDDLAPDRAGEVRLVALTTPNNPTGSVLGDPDLVWLDRAVPADAVLFNDASYGPLVHDGPSWSLLAAARRSGLEHPCLELHSLSKLFGLGAVPVAFLTGDPELVARLDRLAEYTTSAPSGRWVELATRCLELPDHLRTVREDLGRRLSRLADVCRRFGFEPYPAAAGMYLLCRAPDSVGGRPTRTAAEAAEVLLESYDLAVVPWDVPPHRYLRLTALYRPEDLDRLRHLADRARG